MIFGVFDGIHEGHKALFSEARRCGDHVIAVVAEDHIVKQIKGCNPKWDIDERITGLKMVRDIDEVIRGDSHLSSWGVVDRYHPEIILLGYDQVIMKEDLEKHLNKLSSEIIIKVASSFEPNKYHNSIINNK